MNKNDLDKIALMKYDLLSDLINNPDKYSTNKEFFDMQVAKIIKDGGKVVSIKTLERWYYEYKKDGFNGLRPKARSDAGKSRQSNDIVNQIKVLKETYPRMSAKAILETLRTTNTKLLVSLSTINRIINQLEINKNILDKPMYRYEVMHINEVWHGDSSHGPYLYQNGNKIKLYIIAFIDDKSRLITSAKIFKTDNTINLFITMKDAVSKFGVPKKFNFDNGKNYKNNQTKLLAAKLSTIIHYCRPYNPEAKAKIERWFKTLKDQWMSTLDYASFHSIDEYQNSLNEYVRKYNNSIHSSLNGKSPYEVYLTELSYIKKLDENIINDSFLFEIERRVSIDNVVIVENIEFEVPSKYSMHLVKIKYLSLEEVYLFDKEDKVRIKPLDKTSNSKRVRVYLAGDNKNE